MTEICSCGYPLKDAQYIKDELDHDHKSCPGCSKNSGHHVFYPIEEFHERNMGDGRVIVQSYCVSCRNRKPPILSPSFECP